MTENNEAAASAAASDAAAPAAADTNAVVKPIEPVMPDPVPPPPGADANSDVSEEEIIDLRKSALEDQDAPQLRERFITLGETVYYGDGTGQVWPAMIVHVYGRAADNDEDRTDTYVDLQVFKRKQICDVEKVAQHNLDIASPLTGWVFKA